MARTVDPVAHAVRRDAFLDAGQRLIQTKGYALLSIQDIIDEISASKGAFYHYFDSKADLLDGVVSRMVESAIASLAPAVADPHRSALEKLDAVFSGLASFKADRKDLILALLRVWLSDDNVVVREKLRRGVITRMTPLLAAIIRQGVAEGAFSTTSADHAARVFVSLVMGANEAAVDLFLARQAATVTFEEVEATLAAFGEAFERVLGARPGSLGFAGRSAVIREWFDMSPSAASPSAASLSAG
jgi:AcrR family transcriptional regulator